MADLTAQRTLVKSPPELWSELSEVESLARHLGELGEIRIVKVEPESTVAWEGEEVSGTVELEQSGWGTKVTFKATIPEPNPAAEPELAVVEPELAVAEPELAVAEPKPVTAAPDAVAVEPRPVAAAPGNATIEIDAIEIPEEQPRGLLARWLFRRRQPLPPPKPELVGAIAEREPVAIEPAEPEPLAAEPQPIADPKPEPPTEPEPLVASAVDHVQHVLDGTLEALGQAHHRPFSRG
jgi:hypothetical protein